MKIVVEFNSLEEMDQFCNSIAVAPGIVRENAAEAKQEPKKEEPKKRTKTVKEAPVQEEVQQETTEQEQSATEAESAVEYTLEDVRAKLGALQKAGRRDDVKALLQSVGAEKLPEVDPKDYAVLMQKAGELDA